MYESFQKGYVAVDEGGDGGGSRTDIGVNECKKLCDQSHICFSFAYCTYDRSCWLKDKKIKTDNEPKKESSKSFPCTTYYHQCKAGRYLY